MYSIRSQLKPNCAKTQQGVTFLEMQAIIYGTADFNGNLNLENFKLGRFWAEFLGVLGGFWEEMGHNLS